MEKERKIDEEKAKLSKKIAQRKVDAVEKAKYEK